MSESATILCLHASEWALLASGFLLVVGLVGEYRLPTWHFRLKLFELLVLVGCGGELIADAGVFLFSEHLQTIEQLRVVSLKKLADEADVKAQQAIGDARSAHDLAQGASDIAKPAKDTADAAKSEANTAKRNADAVGTQATNLSQGLAVTQSGLDATRTQLLGLSSETSLLADSLAPRRLFFIRYADGTSNMDVLKPIADTEFIIESIPDFEARKAAADITSALELGHFKVEHTATTECFTSDGVTIERYMGPETPEGRELDLPNQARSEDKALRMSALLWANGWKGVHPGWSKRAN